MKALNISEIVANKVKSSSNWAILSEIYANRFPTISFSVEDADWVIRETFESECVFELHRNIFTMNRITEIDKYGLLGVSILDLSNKSVILTEGVSDWFTTKLQHPTENVLGVTNLGGSHFAKCILINCFQVFDFIADNDATGMNNVFRWKQFLTSKGKEVNIYQPESSFKDTTDEFIFNIKFYQSSL